MKLRHIQYINSQKSQNITFHNATNHQLGIHHSQKSTKIMQ